MGEQEARAAAILSVENVGGIDRSEVTLHPGVTVLRGRNASNRTSLLQAIMAALGSEQVSLKAAADRGHAELRLDGDVYRRTLERTEAGTRLDGSPYLEDATVADLFAFLLESNEARRAILREDDLRDVIMRPVDVEAIRSQIREAERRKREIDDSLDALDSVETERSQREDRLDAVESELESVTETLADARQRIEDADVSLEAGMAQNEAVEAKLEEVRSVRTELGDVRERLRSERESASALREELEEVTREIESVDDDHEVDRSALDREIEAVRSRKRSLEGTISQLQSIVQFNRSITEDGGLPETVVEGAGGDDPTQQLLDGETVECWTCGTTVPLESVSETTARLQSVLSDHRDQRAELESRLEDLTARREERRATEERLESLEARREDLESELENREARIESLEAEHEELTERIDVLEGEVESMEDDAYTTLLERHREVNELEFERDRLESERESLESEIDGLTAKLEERDSLEAEREAVAAELSDLRTRIEQIESQAIESFNEQMATVLDLLAYDNIERIWLERKTNGGGSNPGHESVFDLHVVRKVDGVTFEDELGNLSESEREVTGLVFALAGYLVHEVYETVPFMLLDSLEAIDSTRIATLVEHFAGYADYLVVALLPEDAGAMDDRYHQLTDI